MTSTCRCARALDACRHRFACCVAGALLGVALQGCWPGDRADAVVIPQSTAPLTPDESRWTIGLDYRPTDLPLAWLPDDSILVWHEESYAKFDVGGGTCAGSGVYLVPASGLGRARPLAVGTPVCGAQVGQGVAADPTGRFIVYSVHTPPNNHRLVRLNLASGRIDPLVPGCAVYASEPALSPDGHTLALTGLCEGRDQPEWAVYMSDTTGGTPRRVFGGDNVSAHWPAWGPDGRSLAVMLKRKSAARYWMEIAIVDVESGRARVLGAGWYPTWSPDGSRLAYLEDESTSGGGAIRVVDSDGGADHVVFRNRIFTSFSNGWRRIRDGNPAGPFVWGPGGRVLLFTRHYARGNSIWGLDLETGRVSQITAPATPRRRPTS